MISINSGSFLSVSLVACLRQSVPPAAGAPDCPVRAVWTPLEGIPLGVFPPNVSQAHILFAEWILRIEPIIPLPLPGCIRGDVGAPGGNAYTSIEPYSSVKQKSKIPAA